MVVLLGSSGVYVCQSQILYSVYMKTVRFFTAKNKASELGIEEKSRLEEDRSSDEGSISDEEDIMDDDTQTEDNNDDENRENVNIATATAAVSE